MPEDPTPNGPATDADEELRRQLNEQVLQLAGMYANKDGDEAWQQELKKQQARQLEKDKAAMEASKSTASSGFSELAADILGGALAHLTWIIGGVVVLAAIGGGAWLWMGTGAVDEMAQPLAHNIPRKGEPSERPGMPKLRLAAKPDGPSSTLPQKLTPAQVAAAKAALETAAKNAKAGAKGGAPGGKDAGAGESKGAPQPGGAPKPGDAKAAAAALANTAKYAEAGQKEGAKKEAGEPTVPKGKEGDEKAGSEKTGAKKEGGPATPKSPAAPRQKAPGQPKSSPQPKAPGAERMAALAVPPVLNKANAPQKPPAKSPVAAKPPAAAKTTVHRASHSPQLIRKLQALWKQGKTAKHSGDIAGARQAWQQALRLCPGHPGFASSLAKLPSGN